MKTITLNVGKETIETTRGSSEQIFVTLHLLKQAINTTGERGIAVDEMMKRLTVLSILDKHVEFFKLPKSEVDDVSDEYLSKKAVVEFKDKEFDTLKAAWREMRWIVVAKFVGEIDKQFEQE